MLVYASPPRVIIADAKDMAYLPTGSIIVVRIINCRKYIASSSITVYNKCLQVLGQPENV